MEIEINIVNAFSKDGKGGNPAAIVLNADHLSSSQKQAIAIKVGLSETAFIGSSEIADFKFDFFTPAKQIPHCGHATIASFALLKQLGKTNQPTHTKETIDGIREIRYINDEVYMQQQAPQFFELEEEDENVVLCSLGFATTANYSAKIVNTGNSFLILEVENEKVLGSLNPDFNIIEEISEKYNLIGYYIFCATPTDQLDAKARMFGPAYGIEEEAATGMAAGPLAAFLYEFGLKKTNYLIEQGGLMKVPSPSLIKVEIQVENEKIKFLYAGGKAILMEKKMIALY